MRMSVEIHGLERAMKIYDSKKVVRAAKAAMVDAARGAKTEASKQIRAKWNIKARDLNKKITAKARMTANTQTITIGGRPIGLAYFGAKEVKRGGGGVVVTKKKGGAFFSRRQKATRAALGVTVEIERGKKTTLKGAYIAATRDFAGRTAGGDVIFGKTWSVRVLQRRGQKIVAPRSISVASMFLQANVEPKVMDRINKTIDERFEHHLARYLAGPSGR